MVLLRPIKGFGFKEKVQVQRHIHLIILTVFHPQAAHSIKQWQTAQAV